MSYQQDLRTDVLSRNEQANPDVRDASDSMGDQVPQPFIKAFGPDIGVIERTLADQPLTIGRAETSDILLPDPRVSRAHARVVFENGQYVLEDAGSTSGTIVNRSRTERHVLGHGDGIQIGPYILQFRTHLALPGAREAAMRAKNLLRADFSVLPSGIRLRYRTMSTVPGSIFQTGDTLRIGQGGLLVPASTPVGDCACLELELAWAHGKAKGYLGEIVGVIEEQGTEWMCIKLHTVSRDMYKSTVQDAATGAWVEMRPT